MGQQLHKWRSGRGDRLWLSLLIDAMEEAARPEVRSQPVETAILAALRAQLAQTVTRYPCVNSPYSRRNCFLPGHHPPATASRGFRPFSAARNVASAWKI